MNLNDGIHYNLEKTLSYNAPVTMICGAPNKGKTYTVRGYCLKRWFAAGERFVEVCRLTKTKDAIKGGYFDKIGLDPEFKSYEFRCSKDAWSCRRRDSGDAWEVCGYIASLSDVQQSKQSTYAGVRNVVMDEAIIERIDRAHRYKRDEWNLLSRIIDSCVREDVDDKTTRPRLFLLGNSVDLVNPYFQAMGIQRVPHYGYSWHNGGLCLLHYVEPDEYDERRRTETLAGRMGSLTGYAQQTYGNRFGEDNRFVRKKPPRAKPWLGVVCWGDRYGIWVDMTDGYYYVTDWYPESVPYTFSLTREDATPNLMAARRSSKALQAVVDFWYAGAVFFDSPRTRESFLDAMGLFGVR